MAEELEPTQTLQVKLIFGLIGTVVASVWIVWLLISIELSNKGKAVDTAIDPDDDDKNNDLALEVNDKSSKSEESSSSSKRRRRRRNLPWTQKGLLLLTVGVLVLLNYLLLVYLPTGQVWINLVAMLAVLVVFLRGAIADELRKSRLDRLMGILTLFVSIAFLLSIVTYARLSLQEGSIYRGPARIVGYDDTSYNNDKSEQTTRTDLEVAWGGSWACPETSETYCQAFVNGALCEVKADDGGDGDRRLEDGGGDGDNDGGDDNGGDNNDGGDNDGGDNDGGDDNGGDNNDADNDADNNDRDNDGDNDADNNDGANDADNNDGDNDGGDGNDADNNGGDDADDNDNGGDNDNDNGNAENAEEEELEEENEDLEEEVEEEEEENEELEEENEELEEEVEEEEEIEEEDEEYIDEYFFEDDYFEDDYWNYDWDSVWGDYACEDLFDTDLEGEEYDADEAPGNDDWPYVMIYGSCNTCKAYLLDYYSTEHFNSIIQYQTQGRHYAYAAVVSLAITVVFVMKQRMAPAKEHEVELLTNEGGVTA